MNYLNQLEPTALIDIFISHPPHDFKVWLENDLYPCFSLKFLFTYDDRYFTTTKN
jgi:hypothetical protein